MTQVNDGGPAFPCTASDLNNPAPGMSLRDWFAGHAPDPGICEIAHFIGLDESFPKEAADVPGDDPWHIKSAKCVRGIYAAMDWRDKLRAVTRWKYAWADAMITERGGE